MKENFNKIKDLVVKKGERNNKKTIENLVVFVIILIITIIAINAVWKDNKKGNTQNKDSAYKKLAESSNSETNSESSDENIEKKLENILSQMEGVGKVKVLVTYSQTSQIVPLYNQDLQVSTTEESDKEGGTRTISENKEKKDIIYQETNGEKIPITGSIISPKIEGAIITAQGASDVQVKTNIIQATEAVTGLGAHKIQVFEMKKWFLTNW